MALRHTSCIVIGSFSFGLTRHTDGNSSGIVLPCLVGPPSLGRACVVDSQRLSPGDSLVRHERRASNSGSPWLPSETRAFAQLDLLTSLLARDGDIHEEDG